MFPRGLKPGIIINLILLITVAMLLVDLVMIGSLRRELLRSRIDEGITFMTLSIPILTDRKREWDSAVLLKAMNDAGATCLMIMDEKGMTEYLNGTDCKSESRMRRKALDSISTGDPGSVFYGRKWGGLFPERESLVVSYPYIKNGGEKSSAAIQLSLESYNEALQNSQRAFFVYFLVNLLVLTVLGFYRLYHTLVKPINSLVSTAEEFDDNEDFSFSTTPRESEFNMLSRSLNKMLKRINDDRFKLEETVRSLEKTNLDLQKAQQEIIRAEKLASVGRLSAGIAHEIGNPVGIVMGYLDLLKQDNITEEQRNDFLQRTGAEIGRINTIIRQLLDFARQPQDDPHEIVETHQVIHEVEEICRVQPLLAGVAITTDLDAQNDRVFASAGQLKQVFINLLINGADAINSAGIVDGWIRITSTATTLGDGLNPAIEIVFADNGPGIDPDQLPNIFDPFYTTKDPGKGTGLGLSICFTIIEGLGGTIKASTCDEGMSIIINLPVSDGNRRTAIGDNNDR